MIRFFAILAAALVVPAVLPATAGNAFGQAAYVHEMHGSVTATVNSVSRPLKTGDILSTGTTVSTGDKSSAVIKFEDGQIMALAERSSFRIVEYRYVKERVRDSNMVFALLQGGLRFISGVIGSTNRNNFRLTAGTATIGIRGTDGSVYYNAVTQAVNAAVTAGVVALTTPQETKVLEAGQNSGPATDAVQQSFDALSKQLMPINTPVVVASSAAAAAAIAEANRLGTPESRAEADRLLAIAIADAQKAYQQAIDGGAIPPDSSSYIPTSTTSTSSTGIGTGGGGSCRLNSASPC